MATRRQRRIILCVLLITSLVLFVYFGNRIHSFVNLFLEHDGVALTQDEIALAHNSTTPELRRQVVPRIIHQIYHNWRDPGNNTLPIDWEETRQTCIALHKDWEYKLWHDEESRAFVEKEYPWFLSTYDNFKFPVQKIDALRYFLMRHYGGIYIDLDNGCITSLEPLLYYPAWVTDGGCGALSNNILGAEPNHPYWIMMTDSMQSYAWNYPFPYLTISYATGQWYETEIWQNYHAQRGGAPGLTRVMMDHRPGAAPIIFFTQVRGGSWDNWDNYVFGWVGQHLFLTGLGVVGILAVITAIGYYWIVRFARHFRNRSKGYQRLGA